MYVVLSKSLGRVNWFVFVPDNLLILIKNLFKNHMPSASVITFIGIYPKKMIENVDKRFNCKSVHCSTVAKRWIPPTYPIIDLLSTLCHNKTPGSHVENIIEVSLMTLGDKCAIFWMPKPGYRNSIEN